MAAAAVLSGSVDSAAVVVVAAVVRQEPAVRAPRVLVAQLVVADLLLRPEVLVVAQVPREPVLLLLLLHL